MIPSLERPGLKEALAIAIVKLRRGQAVETAKWKRKAEELENDVKRLKTVQQQLCSAARDLLASSDTRHLPPSSTETFRQSKGDGGCESGGNEIGDVSPKLSSFLARMQVFHLSRTADQQGQDAGSSAPLILAFDCIEESLLSLSDGPIRRSCLVEAAEYLVETLESSWEAGLSERLSERLSALVGNLLQQAASRLAARAAAAPALGNQSLGELSDSGQSRLACPTQESSKARASAISFLRSLLRVAVSGKAVLKQSARLISAFISQACQGCSAQSLGLEGPESEPLFEDCFSLFSLVQDSLERLESWVCPEAQDGFESGFLDAVAEDVMHAYKATERVRFKFPVLAEQARKTAALLISVLERIASAGSDQSSADFDYS